MQLTTTVGGAPRALLAADSRESIGMKLGTNHRLRNLLEADRNNLVAAKNGKINRAYYARQLHVSPATLKQYDEVFAEFESQSVIVTGPMDLLNDIRKWLESSFESGELCLRDGKISRTQVASQFNMSGGNWLTRYPEMKRLINQFDRRVQIEGYLPAHTRRELTVLQDVLSGPVALAKDRKSIDQIWLSRTTGISLPRLLSVKSFSALLGQKQDELLEAAMRSRIDPLVDDRVYPFSILADLWPYLFLERMGVRFKQVAAAWASPKGPHQHFIAALRWIGASGEAPCRAVVTEARLKGRIESEHWEEAIFLYRSFLEGEVRAGRKTKSNVDGIIYALRSMLEGMVEGQLLPSTSVPLPGVKHVRRLTQPRPSVAEAGAVSACAIPDYVSFARERLNDACRASGIDIEDGDAAAFLDSIALEAGQAQDLPSDMSDAIRLILERRLNAIRTAAELIVSRSVAAIERGRELLEIATIDGAAFEEAYIGGKVDRASQRTLVRNFFPNQSGLTKDARRQGVANLISLIAQRFSSLPPTVKEGAERGYGQFFQKRYREYGGSDAISQLLLALPEMSGAVLTLYLIASGANLSVGRTLYADCIEQSDVEGLKRITGNKARANGKPIIVDISADDSSVKAIEALINTRGAILPKAGANQDFLFLQRIEGRVQLMTEHWYTNWFKKLVGSVPSIADIRLVPSMIRPSIILHAALSNDGRLATGMAIGKHSQRVTQGYQQRWATRLLYEQNIAKFVHAFEAFSLARIDDAAAFVGISAEELARRAGLIGPTGLGTFCKDVRGRPGSGSDVCKSVDCWDECPHMLIVARLDALIDLQGWQASLREVQGDWERDRPERWAEVWLPWLCLTDVVEMKLTRGPMIKLWNEASRQLSKRRQEPGFALPRPW